MIILLPKIVCNCGWSFFVCVRIFVRGQRQQLCMTCRRMQNKDAAVCACVWESGTGHTVEPPVLHSLYPGHSLQSLFVPATDHMSQYLNSCSRWLCVFSLLSTLGEWRSGLITDCENLNRWAVGEISVVSCKRHIQTTVIKTTTKVKEKHQKSDSWESSPRMERDQYNGLC